MNDALLPSYSLLAYAQPGAEFYACVIPASHIIERLEIRRRSEDPVSGVQRDDSPRRIVEIANYAMRPDSIFPTPVIVSADSKNVLINNGRLQFSSATGSVGHILDGQHRVLGLRQLDNEARSGYQLLVVFVFDIDPYAEATIFATINGNQKQVSKSLMYDLFALDPGRSVGKICHEIVKSLNDDPVSPFYRRIKLLGKKIGDTDTLSQAAFVDQISRQIKEKDSPLARLYAEGEDWVIRKVISNVFNAIDKSLRNSGTEFSSDYFYRTTGFGGVAQTINELMKSGAESNDISELYFSRVMEVFFQANKTPPAGTGNSAMLDIKRRLLAAVEATQSP